MTAACSPCYPSTRSSPKPSEKPPKAKPAADAAGFERGGAWACGGGLADDLVAREELRDLDFCILGAVGAVDGVLADRLGELLTDRTLVRIGRVRGTHHLAVLRDGVLALQHLHDHRARGHELDEFAEEGALAVDAVEGLGLLARHQNALLRDDAQARLL